LLDSGKDDVCLALQREYSSAIEHVPSRHEALASISSIMKKKDLKIMFLKRR
jgi:hypothetical protein